MLGMEQSARHNGWAFRDTRRKQMKKLVQIGIAVFAVGAFALASGTGAEAAKCKKYSASAIGIPADVAKVMAKGALDVEIAMNGASAKGKTHYKCTDPVLAECKATQFACK
jgi:hypothetical protein